MGRLWGNEGRWYWGIYGVSVGYLWGSSGSQCCCGAQIQKVVMALGDYMGCYGVSMGCLWDIYGAAVGHSAAVGRRSRRW